MEQLIRNICRLLDQGEEIALVSIVEHTGSAPRSPGAAMLMTAQDRKHGSIGGGHLEAQAEKAARDALAEGQPRFISIDRSQQESSGLEEGAGDQVELLVDVISPSVEERALFDSLARTLQNGQSCILVRTVFMRSGAIERVERCLINPWGMTCGHFPFGQDMLDNLLTLGQSPRELTMYRLDRARLIIEPLLAASTVYLFGAGQVSKAVADLIHRLDFRTIVLDDREDSAGSLRFPEADGIHILEDYQQAFSGLSIDESSFILILTREHRFDRMVLSQALATRAGYIGMIGSRSKREAIFRSLLSSGFSEADLARVHCPAGLDINAETQEEMAVSIAAELIAVRRGGSKSSFHASEP